MKGRKPCKIHLAALSAAAFIIAAALWAGAPAQPAAHAHAHGSRIEILL